MSAKSAHKTAYVKNPYGNPSRRGRGVFLILTVIVLAMAAGTWMTAYTKRVAQEAAAASAKANTQNVDPSPAGIPTASQ